MKKNVALSLIIIGCSLIALSIGLVLYSNHLHSELVDSFETNQSNLNQLEQLKESVNNVEDYIPENVIGLIRIPSINLKFPILNGIDNSTLKIAVGRFEDSAEPGEVGNMTLIGHNNFILAEPFKKLDELVNGDVVEIITKDNTFKYEVTKKYEVTPFNKDIIKPSSKMKLTLVTCTDNASKRLVVEAELTKNEEE